MPNLVQILIVLTLALLVFYRPRVSMLNHLIAAVLILSIFNELVSTYLRRSGIPIAYSTNIYIVLHQLIWFAILYKMSPRKKTICVAAFLFVCFAVADAVFIEGWHTWRCYTFVAGSFLYVVIFLLDSWKALRHEQFEYFLSDQYLLIASPVLFFSGFSLLFSFSDYGIYEKQIAGITLFNWIARLVNFIYYSTLSYYIYTYKRRQYAV